MKIFKLLISNPEIITTNFFKNVEVFTNISIKKTLPLSNNFIVLIGFLKNELKNASNVESILVRVPSKSTIIYFFILKLKAFS